MSRKFLALCALILAVVMALAGCNLVKVDETLDAASVVASFKGGTVTKGEVEPNYNYLLNYYNSLSSLYGYSISTDGLLQSVVEQAVQRKVLLNKAAELGLTELTAEEEEELQTEASENYEETLQSLWDSYAEEGLTDDEIRADIESYLAENDYTPESVLSDLRDDRLCDKVREHVYSDVSVTPGEVQDRYDEMVAADTELYADTASFENAASMAGSTIAWYPEGYRTVKQVLVMFPEDIQSQIGSIDGEISSVQAEIDRLEAAIADAAALEEQEEETADGAVEEALEETEETASEPEETAGEAEEAASEPEESAGEAEEATEKELLEQSRSQLAALQAQRESAIAEGLAAVQETVDEIYARIDGGEDFQTLIDEFNEDPGMQNEPAATVGYYVCADSAMWLTEFRDAAMTLAEVGDVSEPVTTRNGVHIIRYESDVTPGAVPFEELRESIESTVLTEKQEAAFDGQVAAWMEEAEIKYDLSSFNG